MGTRLKKIEDIELMISSGDIQKITDAIKIYNQLCLDPLISVNDKVHIIISMSSLVPEEAKETITRLRDMIPFVHGKHYDDLISLLVKLSGNSSINPHERSLIAVVLYNRALLDICFRCFESIALDKDVPVEYRVEACRYLYSTEEVSYKQMAQECLTEVLDDMSLKSSYRYGVITSFISTKGVVSYLNRSKIKVPYDEEFIYGLQMQFFHEKQNGVRERILCGQHILQMSCATKDEKEDVSKQLFDICLDSSLDNNTRADAADILHRLGDRQQSLKARDIIRELGYSAVNVKNTNYIERVKTLYNNSQNIHEVSDIVDKFIEKMFSEDIKPVAFEDVQEQVSKLVRSKKLDKSKKFLAYKALNRISIDTALFTSKNVSLAEIFVYVWLKIKKYTGHVLETLEARLIEELIDMGDTCSTGHSGRFVNVLAAVDPDLDITITFEDQIVANIAGRVNALIRNIEDINLKSSISMGMFPDASTEDIEIYKKFINEALKKIFDTMHKEFVEEKWLSEEEFVRHFETGSKEWKR